MAYSKKTWKDRITEYPNRRELTHSDSSTELVTVARSEGTISQEGDAFSAQNMNDLEGRIDSEFSAVDQNLQDINDNLNHINEILFIGTNNTEYHIIDSPISVNSYYEAPEDGLYIINIGSSDGNSAMLYVDSARAKRIAYVGFRDLYLDFNFYLKKGAKIYTSTSYGSFRVKGYISLVH